MAVLPKSVKDLGVGFNAVGVRSPDRGDRVDKAVDVCVVGLRPPLWAQWNKRSSIRLQRRAGRYMGWPLTP